MKLATLMQPFVTTAIADRVITGIQNDSRKIKPGDLFLAYPGAAADGRLFVEKAIEAGAVGIVYEPAKLPESFRVPSTLPCLPVPQLGEKLAAIASRYFDYPSRRLSITGVTGTNGKTTIANQLAEAYGLLGHKAAYIGTLGQGDVHALKPLANTTPDALCLQQCLYDYQQAGVGHVCMEVSSHALCQERVAYIDFSQAIYTNLSHEHLDYHHSMDAYAAAKASLFAMPTLQSAIINYDDAYSALMASKLNAACQKLTYGLQDGCDVRAVNWQMSMSDSQLEVRSPWGMHHLCVNSLGKFNVYNSLAVYASLLAMDIPVAKVIAVMSQLHASPGRMEVVAKKPYVIVDFAHTPDALENVLSTLVQLKKGKLLVVFGCGGDRDKTKRPMMGRIASQYADFVILTSDNPRTEEPRQIVEDIAEGLLSTSNVVKCIDRKQAIYEALSMASPQDIIVIAGKGHEAYQLIGTERFAFSDKDVVCELLNA